MNYVSFLIIEIKCIYLILWSKFIKFVEIFSLYVYVVDSCVCIFVGINSCKDNNGECLYLCLVYFVNYFFGIIYYCACFIYFRFNLDNKICLGKFRCM